MIVQRKERADVEGEEVKWGDGNLVKKVTMDCYRL